MSIQVIYKPILTHFRAKRMETFYRALSINPRTKILDVGGSCFVWQIAADHGLPQIEQITLLNVYEEEGILPSNVRWIVGDGRKLPFADGEFDVVFSNSVIEHLGSLDSQLSFASEIRRVGRSYWVQTPDPRFFVEPHYLSPFVHWLPMDIRRRVTRHATTWGLLERPTQEQIEERLREIRLISPKEFERMFPGAEIITERCVGMPKSLIAKCIHNSDYNSVARVRPNVAPCPVTG